MRIVVTGALDRALWKGRRELLEDWRRRGWEVHVVLPKVEVAPETERASWVTLHRIPLHRASMNPARDLATWRGYRSVFDKVRPDAVFAYNPKPVLYSGLGANRASGIRFVPMVTGRGALERRPGLRGGLAQATLRRLYRASLRRADAILFQNEDDLRFFTSEVGGFRPEVASVIPGSGVNLEHYRTHPVRSGAVRFLVIARLLVDKGVREFVEAAHRLSEVHPTAKFRVVGGANPNHPHGIPQRELDDWKHRGVVEFTGLVEDVRPHLRWCSVLCHPSYAEGTPRAVLEAMSTGRPIITSNAPGCRHTVVPGESGFLVPPRDSHGLQRQMEWFIHHPDRLPEFAAAARHRAEDVFDVRGVVNRISETLAVQSP